MGIATSLNVIKCLFPFFYEVLIILSASVSLLGSVWMSVCWPISCDPAGL